MGWMVDETGLGKRAANHVPLTPLSHLRRAAGVFAGRTALVQGGDRRFTYAEYHARVSQLASALAKAGVDPGDVVATVIPNTLAHVEACFAIPACGGAVLNTINIRLDVDTVAYILDHGGGARAVLADTQFLGLVEAAIKRMEGPPAPMVIEVGAPEAGTPPPAATIRNMKRSWRAAIRRSTG